MQADDAVVVGALDLGHIGQRHALARLVLERTGHVVQAEHNVLRRNDDRLAVGGDRMLFVDIISARASSCASRLSGISRPSGHRRSPH